MRARRERSAIIRARAVLMLAATFVGVAPRTAIADPSMGASAAPATTSAASDELLVPLHAAVRGTSVDAVDVLVPRPASTSATTTTTSWANLSSRPTPPGLVTLHMTVAGGDALFLEIPPCAGRGAVRVDGARVDKGLGPIVTPLARRPEEAHAVDIEVRVSGYESRIACGYAPRFGARIETREGLGVLSFASPVAARGGGQAVVFVPPSHDLTKPAAVLVGAHPWNGGIWTYAAYAELLEAAAREDVVLLFPSGLGNSLYTEPAEDEVVRAMDALNRALAVDPRRVSIWGASMGGAGATTIAFHRPDRFAFVASFFGDSKYDLATYVRSILPDEAAAHRVNALDVVDNARYLDVWLVHGEADRVSPIVQSVMLADALRERGFSVHFERVAKAGHEGGVVAKRAADLVHHAAIASRVLAPSRVTYRSVRARDLGAYGVRIVRAGSGDAFVDVRVDGDHLTVLRSSGVRSVTSERGAHAAP